MVCFQVRWASDQDEDKLKFSLRPRSARGNSFGKTAGAGLKVNETWPGSFRGEAWALSLQFRNDVLLLRSYNEVEKHHFRQTLKLTRPARHFLAAMESRKGIRDRQS